MSTNKTTSYKKRKYHSWLQVQTQPKLFHTSLASSNWITRVSNLKILATEIHWNSVNPPQSEAADIQLAPIPISTTIFWSYVKSLHTVLATLRHQEHTHIHILHKHVSTTTATMILRKITHRWLEGSGQIDAELYTTAFLWILLWAIIHWLLKQLRFRFDLA